MQQKTENKKAQGPKNDKNPKKVELNKFLKNLRFKCVCELFKGLAVLRQFHCYDIFSEKFPMPTVISPVKHAADKKKYF